MPSKRFALLEVRLLLITRFTRLLPYFLGLLLFALAPSLRVSISHSLFGRWQNDMLAGKRGPFYYINYCRERRGVRERRETAREQFVSLLFSSNLLPRAGEKKKRA